MNATESEIALILESQAVMNRERDEFDRAWPELWRTMMQGDCDLFDFERPKHHQAAWLVWLKARGIK